jgi:hypothetical protein
MEDDSKISLITKRIDEAPFGSAFVTSDFTDLAEYETAKKTIARLEKKGTLRRVLRGVYDKPKFSYLLQEYAAPIPDQIAHAIARNYNCIPFLPPANTLPLPPHQHRECRKIPEDWHVHRAIRIFVHMNTSSSLFLLFPGA